MHLLSKYLRPLRSSRSLSNLPNRPFQATYLQRFNPSWAHNDPWDGTCIHPKAGRCPAAAVPIAMQQKNKFTLLFSAGQEFRYQECIIGRG
jgi:hypothetical protein